MKRVEKLWDKMEKLGIRPERLQLEWISAAEGQKWARTMRDLEEMRTKVTEEEVQHTMNILREEREKAEARAAKKAEKKLKPKPATIAVLA